MPSYSSSEDTEVELQQAYGDEANPRVEDNLVVVEDKTGDAGDNLKVIQYSISNNNNNSKKIVAANWEDRQGLEERENWLPTYRRRG